MTQSQVDVLYEIFRKVNNEMHNGESLVYLESLKDDLRWMVQEKISSDVYIKLQSISPDLAEKFITADKAVRDILAPKTE